VHGVRVIAEHALEQAEQELDKLDEAQGLRVLLPVNG